MGLKKLIGSISSRFIRLTGRNRFLVLEELQPFSRDFGYSYCTPVDRFYINNFIHKHAKDIRGKIYEIGDDQYSSKFSQKNSLIVILNAHDKYSDSIRIDLNEKNFNLYNSADCIVLTQTLNFVYNFQNAISEVFNILKPGGVCLLTVAGLSQISRFDMNRWGDFWRFTDLSIKSMLSENFTIFEVESFGNYYASVSFLAGIPLEKLNQELLNFNDEDYQLIIGARMEKTK